MSNFDYLALDGRSLRLFLAVLETGSVTGAAERLGVTQSAVSHTLDKLRSITGDPLFVKAGRGIIATAHAEAMGQQVRTVLEGMKSIAHPPAFDPSTSEREFVVAANDYQRDLLLPAVLRHLLVEAPAVRLRVLPSGMPTADMLREDRCDLILSPQVPVPAGTDVLQQHLLDDELVCFYDPVVRAAPVDREEYLAARHLGVRFDESERANFERIFQNMGIHRDVCAVVGNIAGLAPFMAGTELLAILPRLLERGLMSGFAWCQAPFSLPPLPLYMFWHRRHELDPAHQWLRSLVQSSAHGVRGESKPRVNRRSGG